MLKDAAPQDNSPDESQTLAKRVEKPTSPINLFIRLTVLIFITEGISFVLLEILRPEYDWQHTLAHAVLTTTLILPILFFFSLRPLLFQISERHRVEHALQRTQEYLEVRVNKRTEELVSANQALKLEVAERRRAEQQLRLQTVAVEAAANGIIITDRQGTVEWANPAFATMTGYDLDEVIGQNPRFLKSGNHSPAYYEDLWNTILSNNIWRGEIINRRKDGTLYSEEQTITPVINAKGEITHFIAIKQDISERKQGQARLEQTNRELLALSQAERDQRLLAEGLFKATEALNSSLDLEEVFDRILEQTKRVIPYSAAVVMLKEGQSLRLVRHYGIDEIPLIQEASTKGLSLDAHPILATVCIDRQLVAIPEFDMSPDYPVFPGFEWVESLLAVPLISGVEVVGLIALFGNRPGFFNQSMAGLLEAFAAHAVLAIKNAQLYKDILIAHEQMQALSHRLVDIQENERRNVARELHNEASQALTSLMVGLRLLERKANKPEAVRSGIGELNLTLESVLEELHRLAIDLRPASLDHLGLIPALRQFAEFANQKYGIPVQFEPVGIDHRLNSRLETALYRITQEALTNSVRHAQATQVDILLEQRGEKIVLIIEDNGVGFDPAAAIHNGRLGMFGMRERAEMVGGELGIESTVGVGTTIFVEVPVDDPHFAG